MSQHIEQRDGVYYIGGTRVTLDGIVFGFREGLSPESISHEFTGITLAQVYGAISFYLDHEAEIEQYLHQRHEQMAELERQGTPASDDMRARLDRARQNLSARRA